VCHAAGMDWIDEYARHLRGSSADGQGSALGEEERRILLKLAREVAHGTERVFAPLSTYLVGRFVAQQENAGVSSRDALRESLDVARRLLPSE
jgi:hypothetical protein